MSWIRGKMVSTLRPLHPHPNPLPSRARDRGTASVSLAAARLVIAARVAGLAIALVFALVFCFPACEAKKAASPTNPTQENYDLAAELKLLDETFRIDIQTIQVTYDFYPDELRVDGAATVFFNMRSGQTRPLVHFDPGVYDNAIDTIALDGEPLSFSNSNDVRVREFAGTTQKAIEFQRDLAPAALHTLEMGFHLGIVGYPRFLSEVEDGMGRGNEQKFPTINTPAELARHQLTFRVHGGKPYEMVGSGLIASSTAGDVQTWTLDTVRPISSYTVLFVLMPEADVDVQERVIGGVPVKIMTFKGTASLGDAFNILSAWLSQLAADFGPFPAPGIGVFLVRSGGMEYYGGTICELSALEHEIYHNYFACSVIGRTYRDTWWDEGFASWYVDYDKGANVTAITDDFYSNVVSGRTPIAVGWDERAYEVGRKILQYVATHTGGAQTVIGFMKHLYTTRLFSPFNAMEMTDYLQAYCGLDLHSQMLRWVYSNENGPATPQSSTQKVDLTIPLEIQLKYAAGAR
jgi:hypothetical protein